MRTKRQPFYVGDKTGGHGGSCGDGYSTESTQGLEVTDSPTFAGLTLSGLSDGYFPYHVSDATGFADSPLKKVSAAAIALNSAAGVTDPDTWQFTIRDPGSANVCLGIVQTNAAYYCDLEWRNEAADKTWIWSMRASTDPYPYHFGIGHHNGTSWQGSYFRMAPTGEGYFPKNTVTFSYQIISSLATGTAPLSIVSTTVCTNLNADLLDGNHASAFALSGHNHSGIYEPVIAAGTSSQYWRGDKTWQTLNQAAVAGLTTSDSPAFVTVKCSGLSDGYIPYHVSDAAGLANSVIYTDGTKVAIGTTSFVGSEKIRVNGDVYSDGDILLASGKVIKINGTQVIGVRVIDARISNVPNSGDATTDDLIDAIRDAILSHGLVAAA